MKLSSLIFCLSITLLLGGCRQYIAPDPDVSVYMSVEPITYGERFYEEEVYLGVFDIMRAGRTSRPVVYIGEADRQERRLANFSRMMTMVRSSMDEVRDQIDLEQGMQTQFLSFDELAHN